MGAHDRFREFEVTGEPLSSRFESRRRDRLPPGEQLHVVVYDKRSEYTPPYSSREEGSYYDVAQVHLYCFLPSESESFDQMVKSLTTSGTTFQAYRVPGLAKVEIITTVRVT